jgi:Viral coat protein (S domain).
MPIYTKKPVQYKKKKSVPRRRRATPFADSGRIAGTAAGTYIAGPLGGVVGGVLGSTAGSALGSLFGSGEYKSNLNQIKVNSLINPQSIPKVFSGGRASAYDSVVVRRTEYIKDITTSATPDTFATEVFDINPGQSASYPWLNNLAKNYESYIIRGQVYYLKSLAGESVTVNSSLGFASACVMYDALDTPFTSKRQMENYSGTVSSRITNDIAIGMECKKILDIMPHQYIRPSFQPSNTDIRMYDAGKLVIATQSPGTSLVSHELHVAYDIELFYPKIPEVSTTATSHASRSRTTTTSVDFGSISLQQVGTILPVITSTTATYSGLSQDTSYKFDASWALSAAGTTVPSLALTNGTSVNLFTSSAGAIDTNTSILCPSASGVSSIFYSYSKIITPDTNGEVVFTITPGVMNSGTFGLDLWLNPIESVIIT